ncbi:Uncharacterised protein [Candidatus Tiddalikarchaeum anstoanum]|nr:Uncharacterised protein [Candidatus Tiddalikarchaeum anstoanum]
MSIKFFILLILGLIALGILVGASYQAISPMFGVMPSGADVAITDLLSDCNSKLRTYNQARTEANKKSFCCTSSDLNSNGVVENDEYCSTACSECSLSGQTASVICSQYIPGSAKCS